MTVGDYEKHLNTIIGDSLDEPERDALVAIFIENANSCEPIIDKLGRFSFWIDSIRFLLYADKLTPEQCDALMSIE